MNLTHRPKRKSPAHKLRMQDKAQKRKQRYEGLRAVRRDHPLSYPHFIAAGINRRTGEPHEHRREIARRSRRAGK